jgi:microcin C transport system permease protein
MVLRFNPLTIEKYKRFKTIKRGYYSFIILSFFIIFSLAGELFVNNRALIVKHQGNYYFPTYRSMLPEDIGLDYEYETNYRN